MKEVSWLSGLHKIFECKSDDLNDLAIACGESPETFYLGTSTSGEGIDFITFRNADFQDSDEVEPTPILRSRPKDRRPPTARRGSGDLAIDIGTKNLRIYRKGVGLIFSCPNVIASNRQSGKAVLFGRDALNAAAEDSRFRLIYPMASGVLIEDKALTSLLKWAIRSINTTALINPRIIIATSSKASTSQRQAFNIALLDSGARRVGVIDKVMAAAIGAQLPVHEPRGSLVVDIGAGTTEVGVVSLSGIIWCKAIGAAGDEMNEAISKYFSRAENLLVEPATVEHLKINFGQFVPENWTRTAFVEGRDRVSGHVRTAAISNQIIVNVLRPTIDKIVQLIALALEASPPEIQSDINSINLTGGGALLGGLDEYIQESIGIPTKVAENPFECTVLGCGRVIEHPRWMKGVIDETAK